MNQIPPRLTNLFFIFLEARTTVAPTERPLIITVSPPSLRLREGRQAQFRCQPSRPVLVRWTRYSNGVLIYSSLVFLKNEFKINDPAGLYQFTRI